MAKAYKTSLKAQPFLKSCLIEGREQTTFSKHYRKRTRTQKMMSQANLFYSQDKIVKFSLVVYAVA